MANICLCEGGEKEKGVFGRRGEWLSQETNICLCEGRKNGCLAGVSG